MKENLKEEEKDYRIVENVNYEDNELEVGSKLYKYVGVQSEEDFENDEKRNAVELKKAWFSKCTLLNDPYEMVATYYEYKDEQDKGASYIRHLLNKHEAEVLSLSKAENNLLMWSHYASSHKGYCLQFKVIDPKKFFKVMYSSKKIDCINLSLCHAKNDKERSYICSTLSIKAVDWKYEEEYRVFNIHPYSSDLSNRRKGTLIDYKKVGIELEKIIIGANCDKKVEKILSDLCKKMQIDCTKAYLHEREFRIMEKEYKSKKKKQI